MQSQIVDKPLWEVEVKVTHTYRLKIKASSEKEIVLDSTELSFTDAHSLSFPEDYALPTERENIITNVKPIAKNK